MTTRRIFNTILDVLSESATKNKCENNKKILENSREKRRRMMILYDIRNKSIPKNIIYKVENYIDIIHKFDDETFFSHFRMRKLAFEKLFLIMAPFWEMRGGPATGLEECLYITIWTLANQNSFRELSDRFNKSKSTIYAIVLKVCKLFQKICNIYIKWPNTPAQIEETVNYFNNLRSDAFPNVIGCIDGMHVYIQPPDCDASSYYNRKGRYSMILQAVCKADFTFSNVFFGWPGRSHDAHVFESSALRKGFEEGSIQLPKDIHIVGDSAFPLRTYLMVPYKDSGTLTASQKYFNTKLSSTRIIIEQAFRRLKCKFRILESIKFNKLSTIKDIVLACTILHNFIIIEDKDSICVEDNEFISNSIVEREPIHECDSDLENAKNKRNAICHLISSGY